MTVEWLAEQLKEHNIELTETQKQQFQIYIVFICNTCQIHLFIPFNKFLF